MKGKTTGEGIKLRGCFAFGRTLFYQYDVPHDWDQYSVTKKQLIANFKTADIGESYFKEDIGVNLTYYNGSSLIKKINIESYEFAPFNYELGEYLNIKDHKKSKGINLKLKVPEGWEIREGNRPNIVKKFVKDGCQYLITTTNNEYFFSRNEVRELLNDDSFVDEVLEGITSEYKNVKDIKKSIITVDTYPTLSIKFKGEQEYLGITSSNTVNMWLIFYEDKSVGLMGATTSTNKTKIKALEQLYLRITNSAIFPDQYK